MNRRFALEMQEEVGTYFQEENVNAIDGARCIACAAGLVTANQVSALGADESAEAIKKYLSYINEHLAMDIQTALGVTNSHMAYKARVAAPRFPDATMPIYSDTFDILCSAYRVGDFFNQDTWEFMQKNNRQIIGIIKNIEAILDSMNVTPV